MRRLGRLVGLVAFLLTCAVPASAAGWRSVKLATQSGDVLAVGAGPNRILYLGTPSGLRRSVDGGASWLHDAVPSGIPVADPVDPLRAYVSIGVALDGSPVVVTSADGGLTWSTAPPALALALGSFVPVISRADPTILYALDESQLFVSVDHGATWAPRGARVPFVSLAIDPTDAARLYGYTDPRWSNQTFPAFRSEDGGLSWVPIKPDDSLAVGPDGVLWAGRGAYSTDHGVTWINGRSGPGVTIPLAPGTALSVTLDRTSYAITGLVETVDAGATWVPLRADSLPRSDPAFVVGDDGTLYAANAGVARSMDGGETWTDISTGLDPASVEAVATLSDGRLLAASGSSIWRSADRGATWAISDPGLGWRFAVDTLSAQPEPGLVFALTRGSASRSTDGGATWTPVTAPGPIERVAVSPVDPSIAYAIGLWSRIYRSTDGGTSFSSIPGPDLPPSARDIGYQGIAFDGSGSLILDAVVDGWDGGSRRADYRFDGNASFTSVPGLPVSPQATTSSDDSLATVAANGSVVLAARGSVLDAAGIVWPAHGLPDASDVVVSADPGSPSVGLLADGAAYISGDDGATWAAYDEPLPSGVRSLTMGDGLMFGSTGGDPGSTTSGLWMADAPVGVADVEVSVAAPPTRSTSASYRATVTVRNSSSSTARGVVAYVAAITTDDGQQPTAYGAAPDGCVVSLAAGCPLGDLAPGAAIVIPVQVRPAEDGSVAVVGSASVPGALDAGPTVARAVTLVGATTGDLSVDMSSRSNPSVGSDAVFEVLRHGDPVSEHVGFSFAIPPGATLREATISGHACKRGVRITCVGGLFDRTWWGRIVLHLVKPGQLTLIGTITADGFNSGRPEFGKSVLVRPRSPAIDVAVTIDANRVIPIDGAGMGGGIRAVSVVIHNRMRTAIVTPQIDFVWHSRAVDQVGNQPLSGAIPAGGSITLTPTFIATSSDAIGPDVLDVVVTHKGADPTPADMLQSIPITLTAPASWTVLPGVGDVLVHRGGTFSATFTAPQAVGGRATVRVYPAYNSVPLRPRTVAGAAGAWRFSARLPADLRSRLARKKPVVVLVFAVVTAADGSTGAAWWLLTIHPL